MAIKLTLAEALSLLAKVGVQAVEIVDKAEDSDFVTTKDSDKPVNNDTLLMAVDASREAIIAPKVIQAKTGEIHASVTGRINGALRSQLSQKTGIPTADLKDLDSTEAIGKAYDYMMSKVGGDKETLIAERDSLMQAHSKALKDNDTKWEGKVNEVTGKLTNKEIIAKLVKDHNEAKGLPITANRAALAATFKNYLDGKAIVKYNEAKDEIELYDKANPDLRLYTNESKTTYLQPSDDIKSYYTNLGIWNEDNRGVKPADVMQQSPNGVYVPKSDASGKVTDPYEALNASTMAYAASATTAP